MSDMSLGQAGVIQFTSPEQLELQLQQQAAQRAENVNPRRQQQVAPTSLIGYIRGQYEIYRNHRNTAAGWTERLLVALRTFQGQYDQNKLNDIRRFGGSEIFAKVVTAKARAASSLLRDIYLSGDKPWGIKPPTSPSIPPDILRSIDQLIQQEGVLMMQTGQQPGPTDLQKRRTALLESAADAAKKKAAQQARDSTDKIEDILREGYFYHALSEFLIDIPIYPFACIKGPVVRIIPTVTWPDGPGRPKVEQKPKLTWCRVSPFDLYWTPGVADIGYADVIEKQRLTRAQINDMLDMPGYNQSEVRAVLQEYGNGGLYDNWDTPDAERAVLESREDPRWNRSAMISMMEFNGHIQGRKLQDYGLAVPDEDRDYFVQCFCIGQHVVKAQLIPSPRQRHYYFTTSFVKVPGTPIGQSLTDMLSDLQEAANATLRALVNNISIASGPQVVVNDQRLSPDETGEDMYPWKRWHVRNDPTANNAQKPIEFFSPTDNSQSLITVYAKFNEIADDVSAIPKYIGGQAGSGGAGRTASGLAMLMGNASKILQTVSDNIDRDVIEQLMLNLVDMILLTDTSGILTGEERISVTGVQVAVQRETIRQRQIEYLQATNNPTDMGIMQLKGRASVLRAVSQTIGLDGDEIVPPEEVIEQMQQAQQQQQQQGPIMQQIEKGVATGVEAGIKRITTELTAGVLAQRLAMPEGMPTHIGTPPGGGGAPGGGGPPGPGGGPPGNMQEAARQSSGMQKPAAAGGMAPQSASVVGNAPKPSAPARQNSPGVG